MYEIQASTIATCTTVYMDLVTAGILVKTENGDIFANVEQRPQNNIIDYVNKYSACRPMNCIAPTPFVPIPLFICLNH